MTVTVRPFPKRTYQNGIRPFRPVRLPANNIRPYTLKTWRPPVPEPLPPAPLLGPKELLALGGLVLAQLWGRFASRPAKTQDKPYPAQVKLSGMVPPPGNTAPGTFTRAFSTGEAVTATSTCQAGGKSIQSVPGVSAPVTDVVEVVPYVETSTCGVYRLGFRLRKSNGTWVNSLLTSSSPYGWLSYTIELTAQWTGPNPVALTVPVEAVPLPDGYTPPSPEVEPLPAIPFLPVPAPSPLTPLPQTVPVPETEPLPQPTPVEPGPANPPLAPPVAPQVPRRTVPLPLPGATPTKDGAIVPQAPAPVAVTPPDAHFPVPGAPPVTGNGPRPTPEGIAQELGRLEQKLAKMLNPGPDGPGDGTDRQQLLEQRMRQVWEFLSSITAGGGYQLSSPCEVDDNGDRIVSEVEYGGGFSSIDVLSNKIDALAALLQVHKDLKQPICKQTPAVGQPVTVNFVQVD